MTGTEPHTRETGLMDTISYVGLDEEAKISLGAAKV